MKYYHKWQVKPLEDGHLLHHTTVLVDPEDPKQTEKSVFIAFNSRCPCPVWVTWLCQCEHEFAVAEGKFDLDKFHVRWQNDHHYFRDSLVRFRTEDESGFRLGDDEVGDDW